MMQVWLADVIVAMMEAAQVQQRISGPVFPLHEHVAIVPLYNTTISPRSPRPVMVMPMIMHRDEGDVRMDERRPNFQLEIEPTRGAG